MLDLFFYKVKEFVDNCFAVEDYHHGPWLLQGRNVELESRLVAEGFAEPHTTTFSCLKEANQNDRKLVSGEKCIDVKVDHYVWTEKGILFRELTTPIRYFLRYGRIHSRMILGK